MLSDLLAEDDSIWHQYYELDPRPIPSWAVHFVLAQVTPWLPSATVERGLVSVALLLFAGSARFLVRQASRRRNAEAAWLLLPFAANSFLRYGFYPFVLGVGAWMLFVGLWIRARGCQPSIRGGLALIGSSTLYFLHPMTLALAGMTVAFLELSALVRAGSWRSRLELAAPLLGFLPAGLLVLWLRSLLQIHTSTSLSMSSRLQRLVTTDCLVSFGHPLERLSVLVVAGLLVYLLFDVLRSTPGSGESRPWLALTLTLLVALFTLPTHFYSQAEEIRAGLITHRLVLLFWLSAILWMAARASSPLVGPWVRAVIAVAVVAHAGAQLTVSRSYLPLLRDIERLVDRVPSGATIASFSFDGRGLDAHGEALSEKVEPMLHAAARFVSNRRLVDLQQFQASSGLFEVRYRRLAVRPRPDWILVTGLSHATFESRDLIRELTAEYEVTADARRIDGVLYRRSAP